MLESRCVRFHRRHRIIPIQNGLGSTSRLNRLYVLSAGCNVLLKILFKAWTRPFCWNNSARKLNVTSELLFVFSLRNGLARWGIWLQSGLELQLRVTAAAPLTAARLRAAQLAQTRCCQRTGEPPLCALCSFVAENWRWLNFERFPARQVVGKNFKQMPLLSLFCCGLSWTLPHGFCWSCAVT